MRFDLDGDGALEQLPWTEAGTDDSWLVLDRNGNGMIDDGRELFGNGTAQPSSSTPNGFLALSVFDQPSQGGQPNGFIDAHDAVFVKLRLWKDANHDGISQPDELRSLASAGITGISTDFKWSNKKDRWGNLFRYRAVVLTDRARDGGHFAYDVFFPFP